MRVSNLSARVRAVWQSELGVTRQESAQRLPRFLTEESEAIFVALAAADSQRRSYPCDQDVERLAADGAASEPGCWTSRGNWIDSSHPSARQKEQAE
jgi:hypothetical protein